MSYSGMFRLASLRNPITLFISNELFIDAVSQRNFGLRYYDAFSKQKDVLDNLDVEHESIEKQAKCELTKNERIFVKSMKFALGQLSFDKFSISVSTINEK
ncbi:hypothetical protein ACFU1R_29660 [Priestia megaterium]|uniref:hypothetical protein n=1 Tax=Priestia megaterium TaxID=1404 RepID=UPI003671C165